jgi:hypothetical protein
VVNFKPTGADAGIITMAFSIIIVTQDSNDLELLSFSQTNTPGTWINMYGNSSKFNFDYYGGSPDMVYFLQWVTGQSGYANETFINYYLYAYAYAYPPYNSSKN